MSITGNKRRYIKKMWDYYKSTFDKFSKKKILPQVQCCSIFDRINRWKFLSYNNEEKDLP